MRPPEDIIRDLVKQWLEKAEADRVAARALLACDDPRVWPAVGFHAQQAAEKSLKGFLTWRQTEFSKTHNISLLLGLVGKTNDELAAQLDEATLLTRYGVEFRYPGDYPALSLNEVRKAVALADSVLKTVKESLPENYLA